MVKVEFFESESLEQLKEDVNKYLKDNQLRADHIIKIQYNTTLISHTYIGKESYDFFSYSVMIVIDNWRENTTTVPEGSTTAPIPDGGIERL